MDTFASRSVTRVNCSNFKTSLFDHRKTVMNVHADTDWLMQVSASVADDA